MKFEFDRTFGVEIELLSRYGYETLSTILTEKLGPHGMSFRQASWNDRSNRWRVKSDSSLSAPRGYTGIEIVTPVLQGQEGYDKLELLLKLFADINLRASQLGEEPVFKINASCGLHVHWGVSDWRIKHFRNLFKRYCKFEYAIDKIMPNSRRRNNGRYCESVVDRFTSTQYVEVVQMEQAFREIDRTRSARKLQQKIGTRYVKLNIESFWTHGTIEFRHHSGSFDLQKITAWLFLTGSMVKAADAMRGIRAGSVAPEKMANKFGMMFKGLTKVHKDLEQFSDFFKQRQRQLRG